MRRLLFGTLIYATLVGATAVQAQEAGTTGAQAPSQVERTNAFLASRAEVQRLRAQRLGNLSAVLQQLGTLVRAAGLRSPSPSFVQDAEQKRKLAEAFLTDVTQELTMLGFKPGTGKILTGGGFPLIRAAASRVRGTATLRDYTLLADSLVVGTVTKVNLNDDRQDGYLSTITVNVERSYSGGAAGEVIELRRRSGETGEKKVDASAEAPLKEGDKILLVASKAYYSNSTGKPQGTAAIELAPLYLVEGNQLTPTAPFQTAASLSEIS